MTEPIRIFGGDASEEVIRDRHEQIEKRLEELGLARVRLMFERGGFPPEWDPIILAWATNDKLEKPKEKEKKRGND